MARHARLTWAMARRDMLSRHAGQFLGLFWIVGHPLFLTILYVFIFGIVFKQRMGGTYELPLDYTAYILIGIIPWLTTSAILSNSAMSVVSNSALVKQFNFSLEVLPAKDVVVGCVTWIVGMSVILIYVVMKTWSMHWIWLLLPIAFLLQIMMMLGLALAISAVTVFLRDMKDFVTLFTTAGIFLIPSVYLPAWLPALFKPVIYLNPFSYMIWVYQDILYFGRFEHPYAWPVYAIFAISTFVFGYRIFRYLRPMFGGVL